MININERFIPPAHSNLISRWEHQVQFNLSETGVHPISIQELIDDPADLNIVLRSRLGYPPTNGALPLRKRIAALYPNSNEDNILVTAGGAQANFLTALTILKPGDELIMLSPTYRQLWTISKNFGFRVHTVPRARDRGWAIELDRVERLVTKGTKLIYVCNPNNPTGNILSDEERRNLISIADKVGAWIMADEVCIGMEKVRADETPSLWGTYDRAVVTNSLSKAYGLAGTRIGWILGAPELISAVWTRQDLVTISANKLGNLLASFALSPSIRPKIMARTRGLIQEAYRTFEQWLSENTDFFSLSPPDAGGSIFLRYHRSIPSSELVERLIQKYDTLVVPGEYFGSEGHLRIGFLTETETLVEGLDRLRHCITTWHA